MHVVGLVLHPARDSAEAVDAILGWAKRKGAQVLGIEPSAASKRYGRAG